MNGYVALLLSRLLISTTASHDQIIPRLSGSGREQKLEGLLASLSELNGLQSVVQRKLGEMYSIGPPEGENMVEVFGSDLIGKEQDFLECTMDELRSLLVV